MQTLKRVVALALEEAQSEFGKLCQRMTDQADATLGETLRSGPMDEQRGAGAARQFLREQGVAMRSRMERCYAGLLTRAMQTMHTDLRTGLHDFRADTLTLIDDEVVTRQIEVERLVLRLRDADELSLGHLNLIIAQMHGESEVRERENPFRPYLMARSLYDALHAMVQDDALSKILFDQLAVAMAAQLGGFYTHLREVFESRGIRSRLVARPSALNRRERERMAWQQAAAGRADADQAMRERVARLDALQRSVQPPEDLQDLVWRIFNQSEGKRPARPSPDAPMQQLDAELRQLQRDQAQGGAALEPLAMYQRLAHVPAGPERVVVDLMALLFEFIMSDELLPQAMRDQLSRLHAPCLRAALQDGSMLNDARHPARRLLDRIGSAAAGTPEDSSVYQALFGEIERVVSQVLQRYELEPDVFAEAEQALDGFLASLLRQCDPLVRRCLPAFDGAAQAASQLAATADVLGRLLDAIKVDRRMVDFITGTWAQVLVHMNGRRPGFAALLPQLVWSGQEISTLEERAVLMKMLPGLGRELRAGLAAIGMPEAVAQAALDQLLSLHMDVMTGKLAREWAPHLSEAELRQRFDALLLDQVAAVYARPLQAQFAAEFALHGIVANVQPEPAAGSVLGYDEDWLQWAHAGNAFELLVDGSYQPLRLGAICGDDDGFLFTAQEKEVPLVYSRAALIAAMRNSSLRPFEYAPLFERAVESLMTGAESLAVI